MPRKNGENRGGRRPPFLQFLVNFIAALLWSISEPGTLLKKPPVRVKNTKILRASLPCPPVQRLPRPSRSVHFGEVSETNGHVTRNALAARNNEAQELGKSFS